MIAVDTNVLIHAHRAETPLHSKAARFLSELAHGRAPWSIPWPCVHEFLAVSTNARVFSTPTPLVDACAQVSAWFESPSLITLFETKDHWHQLESILGGSGVTGAKVHDARVAAICLEHGATLCTLDRDFSRFPELKTISPLSG